METLEKLLEAQNHGLFDTRTEWKAAKGSLSGKEVDLIKKKGI